MTHSETVFRDLPASRLALTRPPFRTMDARPGQILVAEGSSRSALFLLEVGHVVVRVDGEQVARMGPGAVFGEIGLFTQTVRTATVVAEDAVTVRILERDGYDALRRQGDPVAGWVERRAIGQLLSRFRQLVADVRLRSGSNAHLLEDPVSNNRTPGTRIPMPSEMLGGALVAAFPHATTAHHQRLLGNAIVQLHPEGRTLAASGLRDGQYGVVLAGEVALMTAVDEGALRITTLGPGEVFGFASIVDGKPRPATVVATQRTTVLWLEPQLVRAELARNDLGPMLREPVLRTLAGLVTRTNATVSLAERTHARVRGASDPIPVTEAPLAVQQDFEPLPLAEEVLPGFDDTGEEWDTWFDVTADATS